MLLRRWSPYLLVLALSSAAFLAAAAVPYRVDTDSGFQLRSLQQWARGESASPGTLLLPDPRDLSRDVSLWSNWWPPGLPFLYAPLVAAGLPLAAALRITSFLLFLLGALGWLGLADRLELPPWTRLLYAVALAPYVVTIGGAASLRSADLLSFAFAPWLARLVLGLGEKAAPRAAGLLLCGLALGMTYWLKYTLFLTALPLAAWLAFRVAFSRVSGERRSGAVRLAGLAALGLGFALPVLALFTFNLRQTADLSEGVTGTRSAWAGQDPGRLLAIRPPVLAASLAGSPGLALFQNDQWITHVAYFSDDRIPGLRRLGDIDRIFLKCLLALPGAVALFWALLRERRRPGPFASLALVATAGFYLELLGVSLFVGYNYLAYEARLAVGLMPLVYPLALAGWMAGRRAVGAVVVVLLLLPPTIFIGAEFLKKELLDRLSPRFMPSETGLWMPELSPRDTRGVRAAVAAALRSPEDVTVLAGPAGWGSPFGVWLEMPRRTLPMGTFFAPLGARYLEASNLRSTTPLRSSRSLGVVLVVAQSLVQEGRLPEIEARFPQVHAWTAEPVPPDARVVIYRGALSAAD